MVSEKVVNQVKSKGFMNFTLSSMLGVTMLTGLGSGALFGAYEYGKSAGYQEYEKRKLELNTDKKREEKFEKIINNLNNIADEMAVENILEYLHEGELKKAHAYYTECRITNDSQRKKILYKIDEYKRFGEFLDGNIDKFSSDIERLQSKTDLLGQEVSLDAINKILKENYFVHKKYEQRYLHDKIVSYVTKLRDGIIQNFKESIDNDKLELKVNNDEERKIVKLVNRRYLFRESIPNQHKLTLEILDSFYSYPLLVQESEKYAKLRYLGSYKERFAKSNVDPIKYSDYMGFISIARYMVGINLNKEDLTNIENHSIFSRDEKLKEKFITVYQDKLYKTYNIDKLLDNVFLKDKITFFVPGSEQLAEFITANPKRAFQKYLFPKFKQIKNNSGSDYDSEMRYSGFGWFLSKKLGDVGNIVAVFKDYKQPMKGLVKAIYEESFDTYKDELVEKKQYIPLKKILEEKKTALKKDETLILGLIKSKSKKFEEKVEAWKLLYTSIGNAHYTESKMKLARKMFPLIKYVKNDDKKKYEEEIEVIKSIYSDSLKKEKRMKKIESINMRWGGLENDKQRNAYAYRLLKSASPIYKEEVQYLNKHLLGTILDYTIENGKYVNKRKMFTEGYLEQINRDIKKPDLNLNDLRRATFIRDKENWWLDRRLLACCYKILKQVENKYSKDLERCLKQYMQAYKLLEEPEVTYTEVEIKKIYEKIIEDGYRNKNKEEFKEYMHHIKESYIDVFDRDKDKLLKGKLMDIYRSYIKENND